MIDADVIVVGGGPAGAACARRLLEVGVDAAILDKASFPRLKLCAGWVTPDVFQKLGVKPGDYPHSLMELRRLYIYIHGLGFPLPTRQYSIRRMEWDHWLLERSGARVFRHTVRRLEARSGCLVIDGAFRCKYLVGAGGTGCPVYRAFFRSEAPRDPARLITTLELELPFEGRSDRCFLRFFENGLPGYSWYVPKGGGYLNIGLGGKQHLLKEKGLKLTDLWRDFVEDLKSRRLLDRDFSARPAGYYYFLRDDQILEQRGNVFVVGDAAGLATEDLGEGIGAAVESGLLAAEAILEGSALSLRKVRRYSWPSLLFPWTGCKGLLGK